MSIIDNIFNFGARQTKIEIIPGLLPEVVHPVVIVPGFLGNWPPQSNPKGQLDPITHVYTNLYELLCKVGYVPGVSLFPFSYDWRRGLDFLSIALASEIKTITGLPPAGQKSSVKVDYSKVDIIAHSMGGLVSRAYIQSDFYADNVSRFLCVATPHAGTTAAYYAVFGGDSSKIGIPIDNARDMIFIANLRDTANPVAWISGIITLLRKKVEVDLLKTFSNMPAVLNLLPLGNTKYLYCLENGQEKVYPFGTEPGYFPNPTLEKLDRPENLDKLDQLEEMIFFYSASYMTQHRVLVEAPNDSSWSFGKAVAEQPPECFTAGDTVVPAPTATPNLNPYKSDGSPWNARQQTIEVNKVLNRGVNHIDIVGDPDAARLIVDTLLNSNNKLTPDHWNGLKLSERKMNVRALFF